MYSASAVTVETLEAFHTPVSITPSPDDAVPRNVECSSRRLVALASTHTAMFPELPEVVTHTLLTVTLGAAMVSEPSILRF
jgi:hypothetical protein